MTKKGKRRPPDSHFSPKQPPNHNLPDAPTQPTPATDPILIARHFSGPLPPPEILMAYEKLGPGEAQRILERFHRQSEHRMELEKIAMKTGARDSLLGIVSAFLLAALSIGCGTYIALQGHSVEGTVIGGVAVVGLTTAFIYGTSQRKIERERKQRANP